VDKAVECPELDDPAWLEEYGGGAVSTFMFKDGFVANQ
jgi:hypothetical protein